MIGAAEPWHVAACAGWGSECDHHVANDDHSMANLRWLSGPCHAEKTKGDALRGLRAVNAKKRHPGSRALPPGLR